MRARRDVPPLRSQRMMTVLRDALRKSNKASFRVVHFSVQNDHVHLIVEAADGATLRSGTQGLAIRLARGVNRATRAWGEGRTGKVWADRYHRHDLRTPREVRNVLVYVLTNHRKHLPAGGILSDATMLDPCSSAPWFEGWRAAIGPRVHVFRDAIPRPTASPRTWLAREGWRRHGLITLTERPAARR